jgi:hypothetical protein
MHIDHDKGKGIPSQGRGDIPAVSKNDLPIGLKVFRLLGGLCKYADSYRSSLHFDAVSMANALASVTPRVQSICFVRE